MRTSTALIRIRFPHDLVDRLDQLAERLRVKNLYRTVPRAALIRALVEIHMGDPEEQDREQLQQVLRDDPVKRGHPKSEKRRRRVRCPSP